MLTECDHNNGDQLSTIVTVMDGFSFSQRQQQGPATMSPEHQNTVSNNGNKQNDQQLQRHLHH